VAVRPDPQIVHAALADQLRQVELNEPEAVLPDERAEVEESDPVEPGETTDRDVLVDGSLEQHRLADFEERDDRQESDGDRQLDPVGPDLGEDPAHQGSVEGLAEEVLGRSAAAYGPGAHPAASTARASTASCSR